MNTKRAVKNFLDYLNLQNLKYDIIGNDNAVVLDRYTDKAMDSVVQLYNSSSS